MPEFFTQIVVACLQMRSSSSSFINSRSDRRILLPYSLIRHTDLSPIGTWRHTPIRFFVGNTRQSFTRHTSASFSVTVNPINQSILSMFFFGSKPSSSLFGRPMSYRFFLFVGDPVHSHGSFVFSHLEQPTFFLSLASATHADPFFKPLHRLALETVIVLFSCYSNSTTISAVDSILRTP